MDAAVLAYDHVHDAGERVAAVATDDEDIAQRPTFSGAAAVCRVRCNGWLGDLPP